MGLHIQNGCQITLQIIIPIIDLLKQCEILKLMKWASSHFDYVRTLALHIQNGCQIPLQIIVPNIGLLQYLNETTSGS